ncbi:uncharacterized protein [Rutidosis leptorrhynchoides]|uniref:uncharacterized protein n=1 Tax=Rutidosis leptorrhynchoides TaxID=125765 RepID=UPI003A9A540A
MRHLKSIIKPWMKDKKVMEKSKRDEALDKINMIELKIEAGQDTNADHEERNILMQDIENLKRIEDMDTQQKCRLKWDAEGDENFKYFHCLLKKRRSDQMIKGITVNGEWVTEPKLIKEAFFNFYESKFMAQGCVAVWEYGSDKAPGPDGFNFAFIKKYWDILKDEVISSVAVAFNRKIMPRGMGLAFFFTLIPKVKNPSFIKDYRPISLIGVMYKIITKILAMRLVKVLDKIIGKEQSYFITGRQILDGPLILNETIEWYKRRKEKLLILKIDFEKAYDTVNWEFLDYMLRILGFGTVWRSWVRMVLVSARTSILVNGSLTKEFAIRRGLRQGDPISPFLFLIVMEGLHLCIKEKIRAGALSGASVGNPSITLSHLFYADDAIFISSWRRNNLEAMLQILDVFHLHSGLAINIAKSAIYGIGVGEIEHNDMVSVANCSKGTIWRFVDCPESKWASVIRVIYGVDGSIDGVIHGSSVWPTIVNLFGKLKRNELLPSNVLRVKVDNGHSIRFWKDNWRRNGNLGNQFNRLMHLDVNPNCLLSDRLVNNMWRWNWSRADIGPRNVSMVQQLNDVVCDIVLRDEQDRCEWTIATDRGYSVSDTRRFLDEGILPSSEISAKWWKFIPRKVNILLWRLAWDRLPTRLNFSKRGMEIKDIGCPCCTGRIESCDHVFFECDIASDLWRKVRIWVDLDIPIFDSWSSCLSWIEGYHLSVTSTASLFSIIASLIWHI